MAGKACHVVGSATRVGLTQVLGLMKSDTIAEVSIDSSVRLHVRPTCEEFPHVWRAAMEVYWSDSSCTLHSPPPRTWSYVDWYRQIIEAAKDEYGCTLVLTSGTTWVNVPAEIQRAVVAVAGAEA